MTINSISSYQTSKHFHALMHEPRPWTAVYYRMRETHPLSCSKNEFAALPPWQSERLLVRASKTEKMFSSFRESAQHHLVPSGQTLKIGPVVALSFLSERFLLSVDDTTMVYVWNMSKLSSAEAPAFPCARLALVGWKFLAYSTSSDHSTLNVALSKAARYVVALWVDRGLMRSLGPRAHIFSLSLPVPASDADEPKLSFRNVAHFDTHFNTINSIDVDSSLVLLQLSDTIIEVMDWRTERRANVALLPEPAEVLVSTSSSESESWWSLLTIFGSHKQTTSSRSANADLIYSVSGGGPSTRTPSHTSSPCRTRTTRLRSLQVYQSYNIGCPACRFPLTVSPAYTVCAPPPIPAHARSIPSPRSPRTTAVGRFTSKSTYTQRPSPRCRSGSSAWTGRTRMDAWLRGIWARAGGVVRGC